MLLWQVSRFNAQPSDSVSLHASIVISLLKMPSEDAHCCWYAEEERTTAARHKRHACTSLALALASKRGTTEREGGLGGGWLTKDLTAVEPALKSVRSPWVS